MFKLMIADDNPYTLNELITFIDWEDFDMEIVGTFGNGKLLLDAVTQNMPDLVITDISMPVMDGIHLASCLRELSSDIKIIFLSSYADFEYAQKALQMQISGYLLKPFENAQFTELLNRVLKELKLERYKAFEQNRALHELETLRSLALENFISELLHHSKEDTLISSQLKELKITFPESCNFQIASIHLILSGNMTDDYNEKMNHLRSIIYSYAENGIRLIFIPVDIFHFSVLLVFDMPALNTSDFWAKLIIDIEAMTGMKVIVGCSKVGQTFLELPALYEQAKLAATQSSSRQISFLHYDDISLEQSNDSFTADSVKEKKQTDKIRNKETQHIHTMKQFIHTHYIEPITTRDVAQATFLSPTYANQCFQTECGCTIHHYITQYRIAEAKRLLTETDEQITMIAELVGYNGKTNFYLAFKRNVGMSPTEYRKKHSS